jgi:predicted ribosome quality control (RQC) complex YloA/Tae2 family protein
MTTDWILIRRAAAELEAALRGARLEDAGLLDDGRVALRFALRRGATTLAVDAFGTPPLVTLEDTEPALADDPGWLRTTTTTLRGMRVSSVRARRGDRVLVLTLGSASRFGVASEARVVLELVPRYGNVVVLRDRTVVAAAKQFSPAENEARAVQVGHFYQPPPLGNVRLPRPLEASLAAQGRSGDTAAAEVLLGQAEAAAAQLDPLIVYRDPATQALLAVSVVPLAQFAGAERSAAPQLLALFARDRLVRDNARLGDRRERRRSALLARVDRRAQAVATELAAVTARRDDAERRDRLRESGDALFTHAHEVPPGAASYVPPTNPALTIALDPQLDAKANALRYYARYRKDTDALPHLERRAEVLASRREALEALAFELERAADGATLAELEADLDALEGRPPARTLTASRKRAPLRIDRPSGARIYVGRSPRENVEVTFRIARPEDLWFHARGIPGSHVVLQPPDGRAPDDADLAAAADLAATHSRGRASGRVEIDYTERKHVRKQRDGAPGLVWYTHARSRLGVVPEGYAPVESASRNAATTRGS